MRFQEIALAVATFGKPVEEFTTGVAVVLALLFGIGLFVLADLKGIADNLRLNATDDLFQVAPKNAFERTARDKDLLLTVAPGEHRSHIGSTDTGVAGLHQERSRRRNAQGTEGFIRQFF